MPHHRRQLTLATTQITESPGQRGAKRRDNGPRNPSPCLNCSLSKVRCVMVPGTSQQCERCIKRKHECQKHVPYGEREPYFAQFRGSSQVIGKPQSYYASDHTATQEPWHDAKGHVPPMMGIQTCNVAIASYTYDIPNAVWKDQTGLSVFAEDKYTQSPLPHLQQSNWEGNWIDSNWSRYVNIPQN